MRKSVADVCWVGVAAAFFLTDIAVGTSEGAPTVDKAETAAEAPFGSYLAGRHAQHIRDYQSAVDWLEEALRSDPESPELITRTFLMEASVGRFDKAKSLAESELKLDSSDAMAELVLLVERVKAGDQAGAVARADALPQEGVHRFVRPLARAWTQMAIGDVAGADEALRAFDKFNGFAPLKFYQLGLLYDFAGNTEAAADNFKQALDASGQLNWRLTDSLANFYQRHGREDEATALYERFVKDNAGSELAESVLASRPKGVPPPLIGSAEDGLAEALFDLASVVNQPETLDLALLYARCALELRPHMVLDQLLLADVLSAQNKPEQSLAILSEIPQSSPYSWSARLRIAANLELLDRTDEAVAQLKEMAAEEPARAGADMQLGDLLRGKKRFTEAVDAYDEAVRRFEATGMPERWSLYYSRGIALERSGQWNRAEADLQRALELKPDQPLVLNYLGYSWIDRGENLQRGLEMIQKAVELRPEDGYIVDSLGWAHYRLGDYSSAVQYLEKAIELVPEDPTINDHLGDAYWQSGRAVEARYQWRRALQFGPQDDEIKPIQAKLDGGSVPTAGAARGG
ncbi:MAG: tetratricopeptide repeat protein [Alphaproteobacteria bacterium]|nr:tetratricopeptide repeat protein [Alphaproteobacteria bacterium]